MFMTSAVKHRYFEMQVPETGEGGIPPRVLNIAPPKLKTLRRLEAIGENGTVDEVAAALAKVVSRNKENCLVSADTIMEWWDTDEMVEFLTAYMNWLKNERVKDPN